MWVVPGMPREDSSSTCQRLCWTAQLDKEGQAEYGILHGGKRERMLIEVMFHGGAAGKLLFAGW
jgi:hypothetical protein